MKTLRLTHLLGCALLALASLAAQAQQLEEVIVTAQKRAESLQDVAISLAVVSGAELAALNKTQIADLSRLVPGLPLLKTAPTLGAIS
jgi:iron complex outermembrane receptor protein